MYFERELNVFLDRMLLLETLNASTSEVCPSGGMHRRTFPDLEWGVSISSRSLVAKHEYRLGQITKRK